VAAALLGLHELAPLLIQLALLEEVGLDSSTMKGIQAQSNR
jgi:hypothetical protein